MCIRDRLSTLLFLFVVAYKYLLKNNRNYNFLRFFCIGSILASLLIPLLPSFQSTEIIKVGLITLPTITISPAEGQEIIVADSPLSLGQILSYIYLTISALFAGGFLLSLFKIYQLIIRSKKTDILSREVLLSNQISEPCSIFNHIILPISKKYSPETLNTILQHEEYHIKYGHSSEKLFLQLIKVVLWFHPAVWYLKNEITLIHEYQVDEAMGREVNISVYQQILIELATNRQHLNLVNPFTSHIKKRITMMKSINNFNKQSYFFLALLLVGGSLFLHACQKENNKKIEIQESESGLNSSNKSQNTDADYLSLETKIGVDTVIVFNPTTKEEKIQVVRNLGEHEALFPGCNEVLDFQEMIDCSKGKLLTYIYLNLKYPESARSNKIEGVVLTKLQISKSGQLDNYEIIKSPDAVLSQSVESVINKIQSEITWIPGTKVGEKVNSELVLPIKFKLD